MREKLYHFLVNRYPEVQEHYHRYHDDAVGAKKLLSWIYLLFLNILIRLPHGRRRMGQRNRDVYEQKCVPAKQSESMLAAAELMAPEEMAARLAQYDVISFDVFDTLLFRPFSDPTDLFWFAGEKLCFLNFKELRVRYEREARRKAVAERGNGEIGLSDLWEMLSRETGIDKAEGMRTELELEERFCYANPYMLAVYGLLKQQGKRVIAVSDMYLPRTVIEHLLKRNGFDDIGQIFVSCEYGKSKAEGTLFSLVKESLPEGASVVHVGDNRHSDVKMAEKNGFAACYYPNADRKTGDYRTEEMSPVIGGAYRGIVNHHLYNGCCTYDMPYEYGFIYGGLFVLGYCSFIRRYCRDNAVDKVLFLSRDGDILMQAYELLYPGAPAEYVYWSRAAATKLMAQDNRYDYFRRFLYHKVNSGRTLQDVFSAMDMEPLLADLPEGLCRSDVLTGENVGQVKRYFEDNWEKVLARYDGAKDAAKEYFAEKVSGCANVCAVDIGWAGSGAVALSYLMERKWGFPCRVTGIVAGTNTQHSEERYASEPFLQSGRLVSYLYSSAHNRDLWKTHDPNRDYNVYWELLLASPTRQFLGFARDDQGKIKLEFGEADHNTEGMRQIQKGILDFIREYQKHFAEFPQMLNISGRDAYAPMLAAAGEHEAYLETIKAMFDLKVQVGE